MYPYPPSQRSTSATPGDWELTVDELLVSLPPITARTTRFWVDPFRLGHARPVKTALELRKRVTIWAVHGTRR